MLQFVVDAGAAFADGTHELTEGNMGGMNTIKLQVFPGLKVEDQRHFLVGWVGILAVDTDFIVFDSGDAGDGFGVFYESCNVFFPVFFLQLEHDDMTDHDSFLPIVFETFYHIRSAL